MGVLTLPRLCCSLTAGLCVVALDQKSLHQYNSPGEDYPGATNRGTENVFASSPPPPAAVVRTGMGEARAGCAP